MNYGMYPVVASGGQTFGTTFGGSGRRRGRYPRGSGQSEQVIGVYTDPNTGEEWEEVAITGAVSNSGEGEWKLDFKKLLPWAVGIGSSAIAVGVGVFVANWMSKRR